MAKSAQKVEEIKRKMSALGSIKTPTSDYKEVSKWISNNEKKLNAIKDQMEKFVEIGGKTDSKRYKSMQYDVAELRNTIACAKSDLQDLVNTGKAFTLGSNSEQYAKLNQQLQNEFKQQQLISQQIAIQEMRLQSIAEKENIYQQKQQEIVENERQECEWEEELRRIKDEATIADERTVELLEEEAELQERLNVLKQAGVTAGYEEYDEISYRLDEIKDELNGVYEEEERTFISLSDRLRILASSFSQVANIAKKTFSVIGKGAKAAGRAILSIVPKEAKLLSFFVKLALVGPLAFTRINKQAKSSGGAITNFGNRILNLAKTVFVFGLLQRGLTSLRSGIQEGLGTYLNYDASLKSAIAGLKASLSGLQASLASAFAPILSVVVPLLSTLINYLITAANAVAAFFAALTGASSYKKAVVSIGGVGDAASGAAGSMGDATKAAKELKKELAGYDELNVIQRDTSSGDSGGSGGSGGGGGASDGGISYEDVAIDSAISDFADKLKEAWAQADFTEIGAIVGEKLKDALDNIDWTGIQTVSAKIGKSIATFINGAVEVSGLGDSVGRTVGELLNTGIAGADAFVSSLHFNNLGGFVADAMNSAISTIEWADVGEVIRKGLNGIFDAAATWSGKFNFGALGTAVSDTVKNALNGITWTKANTAAENIGSGIASALKSVMTKETFESVGKAAGKAITAAVKGANAFFDDTDFYKIGSDIASGISKFITETSWKDIGRAIGNALQSAIDLAAGLVNGLSWSKIRSALQDFFEGVAEKVDMKTVGNIIMAALGVYLVGNMVTAIGSKVLDNIGTAIADAIAGGVTTAAGAIGASSLLTVAIGALIAAAVVLVDWEEVGSQLKDGFENMWRTFIENIQKTREETGVDEITVWTMDVQFISDGVFLDRRTGKYWVRDSNGVYHLQGNMDVESATDEIPESEKSIDGYNADVESATDKISPSKKNIEKFNADIESSTDEIPQSEKSVEGYDAIVSNIKLGDKVVLNKDDIQNALAEGTWLVEVDAELGIYKNNITGDFLAKDANGNLRVATDIKSDIDVNKLKMPEVTSIKVPAELIISQKGADATWQEKLQVIADVTGVDYTGVPVSDKYIDGIYAEIANAYLTTGYMPTVDANGNIVSAYVKNGITVSAPFMAASLSNNGKSVIAPFGASSMFNNGQSVFAPFGATSLSSNGKTVTAGVKASSISGNGKTLKSKVKVSSISNSKTMSTRVRIVGQTNTPTISAKVRAVDNMWARHSAKGGVYSQGVWRNLPQFSMGGIINLAGKMAKFATGGTPDHGTAFIAGEAGPEIVGHIGGRTEILNKSQIASAIYSAVVSGITGSIPDIVNPLNVHFTDCTNAVIANIGSIIQQLQDIRSRTYGAAFALPDMPSYSSIPDINKINAIQNRSNVSGAFSSGNTAWMDTLAEKINAGGGNYTFIAQLDGREIFRETIRQNEMYRNQTGNSAFDY